MKKVDRVNKETQSFVATYVSVADPNAKSRKIALGDYSDWSMVIIFAGLLQPDGYKLQGIEVQPKYSGPVVTKK